VAIINLGRLVTESTVEDLVRGQGEFAVAVDQAPEALALLRAQPWGASARLDGNNTIITAAPNGHGRELNLFLVKAGFVPETLALHAQDLEDVFLSLTGSTAGEVK
jgi:ABC-2 type transport system ATP-binding protein